MIKDIDELITDGLREEPGFLISSSFTDRLVKKIEKKIRMKELLVGFFYKSLLVMTVLLVFALVLFLPGLLENFALVTLFKSNWKLSTAILFLVVSTLFLDQVVFRYFFPRSNPNK